MKLQSHEKLKTMHSSPPPLPPAPPDSSCCEKVRICYYCFFITENFLHSSTLVRVRKGIIKYIMAESIYLNIHLHLYMWSMEELSRAR